MTADRPRAARLANAGMILAQLCGAAAGAGLVFLVGATLYFVPWGEFTGPRAGPWWMRGMIAAVLAGSAVAGLGVFGGCLYGVGRRVRGGGRPRPASLTRGRRFAGRLRGAALLAVSLPLALFCLWWTWYVGMLFWNGAFGPLSAAAREPVFYVIGGALAFGATASVSGVVSAVRRLLAPPDRAAG